MKRTTFVTTLAASALLAACGGDKPTSTTTDGAKATLKFSAIPDQNSTELKEKFDALAAHLSEKLSIPVEYIPSSDYGASVELFKNGDIQLAWFGGLTGVQARAAVEGANAIVQGKADPEYFSYFIANADTGLEKSEEFPAAIKDLKFTFGSEQSTSGRLMPSYFIEQASGMKPEDFFSQPVGFSGSHDKTCELIESGQWQVGALSYKTYDKLTAAGKIDPAKAKVIWKTPVYADYNFTAHPALEATYGEGFTQKLADTLIAIKDPALLSAFPREALIPAKNEDFDGIVKVAKELGFLR